MTGLLLLVIVLGGLAVMASTPESRAEHIRKHGRKWDKLNRWLLGFNILLIASFLI